MSYSVRTQSNCKILFGNPPLLDAAVLVASWHEEHPRWRVDKEKARELGAVYVIRAGRHQIHERAKCG